MTLQAAIQAILGSMVLLYILKFYKYLQEIVYGLAAMRIVFLAGVSIRWAMNLGECPQASYAGAAITFLLAGKHSRGPKLTLRYNCYEAFTRFVCFPFLLSYCR
jgi:Na+-translocating ferredoxin:NAD+ oxidoreductase RnfA subunit